MVLGTGAVPEVHALGPFEEAVAPGVIVIVQLLEGASVDPQVVEELVPLGYVGDETLKL